MAAVINTTIRDVTPRQVTRKSDGQQITLWEVIDGDGTKWTARKDIATLAQNMLGQPVTIVTRVEQNGSYTNRYLDAVELNMGAQIQQEFNQPQAPNYAQAAMQAQPQHPTPQPQYVPDDRIESIYRQTACKVAAHISTGQLDFWKNVGVLINFFRTGIFPIVVEDENQNDSRAYGGGYDNPPPDGLFDDSIPF